MVSAASAAIAGAATIGRRCLNESKCMFGSPLELQDEYAGIAHVHAHGLARLELARAAIDEVDGASVIEAHDDAVAVARGRIVVAFVGLRGRGIADLDRLAVLHDPRRKLLYAPHPLPLMPSAHHQR